MTKTLFYDVTPRSPIEAEPTVKAKLHAFCLSLVLLFYPEDGCSTSSETLLNYRATQCCMQDDNILRDGFLRFLPIQLSGAGLAESV
jgi:hypothetical protein